MIPRHVPRVGLAALAVVTLCATLLLGTSALAGESKASRHQTLFCDQSLADFVNTTLYIATITTNSPTLGLKQYRVALSDATSDQKKVVWAKVSSDCLSAVAAPAKSALTLYTAVAAEWAACTKNGSCNTASAKTYRSHDWNTASRKIHAAFNQLA